MDKGRFNPITNDKERKISIHNGTSIISKPLKENMENGIGLADTWLHDAGWRRKKSLAQMTREALPRMENYRNSKRALKRPSLGELHGETVITEEEMRQRENISPVPVEHTGIKLGWIQGVLIPCLLNIWGVMLFLRISWVVAQAGIGYSLIIITISAIVCVITTLSMSAICTNGEVRGGGIYYIISRSLGPEFGASVGIIFAFANSVAASMNTIGFCDSLNDLLKTQGVKIIDNGVNDVRIVGIIALIVMCIICAVGMEWESKAQNFLIAIIVVAIFDFLIGAAIGPKDDLQIAQGFVGLSSENFVTNWGPDFRYSESLNQDFFSVFAIFFPSVTGIQAGANISGDLKDPASAIPKGTLLSLLISMISYAFMVLFAGSGAARDASGNITDIFIGNLSSCAPNCTYGLHNSYSVMQLMSLWGPFIYAGCWAATLSTALTNIVSVPRLIQALGIDRIYPGLIYFSKGYGKSGEPYRGYVLTFLVSAVFLLIADLNTIAPLISNFYLASYALINFCTFHAALIKPLGWRPTFKYFNKWLSLLGFIACVGIMCLISWMMSLVTFIIFLVLYLLVMYRKPDVNWGSSKQAQTYKTAVNSVFELDNTSDHVKNYWPQFLVLCGPIQARPALVEFVGLVEKRVGSLCMLVNICQDRLSNRERIARNNAGKILLRKQKIRAFYSITDGLRFEEGARAFMQSAGIGKLKPNILLMGYKCNWMTCNKIEMISYFNTLHAAFENRLAVTILRSGDGLDAGVERDDEDGLKLLPKHRLAGQVSGIMLHSNSDLQLDRQRESPTPSRVHTHDAATPNTLAPPSTIKSVSSSGSIKNLTKILTRHRSNESVQSLSIFSKKKSGTFDVWWLYDDGGLTILLPYIIAQKTVFPDTKLRIFALANRKNELELEERNMASLLARFRLNYTSLTMVQDITEVPQPNTIQMFESIIAKFREKAGVNEPEDCTITEAELKGLREKTYRQLRIRELLLENSRNADLIVMSLPMPRKGSVSAPLYMSWLEMMSRDLPPTLFVRGNHSSVLTFYS